MRQQTILMASDEVSIQNVLRMYLESAGFRVICTDNGTEALSLAAQRMPDFANGNIRLDVAGHGWDGGGRAVA
ncbi:MAG: hypothetical protein ACPGWR_27975 [Ardenticatenaceae bacterium]